MTWLPSLGSRRSPKATSHKNFRPAREALEERQWLSVGYHGGPLLANVDIETLFYGAVWNDNTTVYNDGHTLYQDTGRLNGFLGAISNSLYLDQLKEYSEPGYVIGRG